LKATACSGTTRCVRGAAVERTDARHTVIVFSAAAAPDEKIHRDLQTFGEAHSRVGHVLLEEDIPGTGLHHRVLILKDIRNAHIIFVAGLLAEVVDALPRDQFLGDAMSRALTAFFIGNLTSTARWPGVATRVAAPCVLASDRITTRDAQHSVTTLSLDQLVHLLDHRWQTLRQATTFKVSRGGTARRRKDPIVFYKIVGNTCGDTVWAHVQFSQKIIRYQACGHTTCTLTTRWEHLRIHQGNGGRVVTIKEARLWFGFRCGLRDIIPIAFNRLADARVCLIERVYTRHTELTFRAYILTQE
jgi:hypothetical protein